MKKRKESAIEVIEMHSGPAVGHSSLDGDVAQPSTQSEEIRIDFKSTIQAFEQLGASQPSPHARQGKSTTKKRPVGPLGRSLAVPKVELKDANIENAESVNVAILSTIEAGNYKVTTKTTFSELRELIAHRLGHQNFIFQDATTKRPLRAEERAVRSIKGPIMIAQCGLDHLMADATLHESANTSISTTSEIGTFKVFWWDSAMNTSHLVWLRMDAQRITVTMAGGGSFRLFDATNMRFPLMFVGVKGSEKGFQLVKSSTNRMSSRFFAQSVEQKRLISIYFCFVWRPNAVRRGYLPRSELDLVKMESMGDAIEPRHFLNILRRHVVEIHRIIDDIERSMGKDVVRHYFSLFAQMFTGGWTKEVDSSNLSNSELQSFGKVTKLMEDWHNSVKKNKLERPKEDINTRDRSNSHHNLKRQMAPSAESISFADYFGDVDDPFDIVANMVQQLTDAAPLMGEGGIPLPPGSGGPPPPPPPPGALAMKQRPAICPINFDAISAGDISGSIWAEMSDMTLKDKEIKRLQAHLTILFGRQSRDKSAHKKDEDSDGIIEIGRLRNLEVLLFMEELKGLSTDEMINMILNFDNRIFCPEVLARLVRKVGKGLEMASSSDAKGIVPTYAFLPTQQESDSLVSYQQKHGDAKLRPGEVFFLNLTQRVPDRFQRFEFGHLMCKVEAEVEEMSASLDVLFEADLAIRSSTKLKAALKLILDILTTLMPRFGLTRGFRISSFLPSVERVSGSVHNPDAPIGPSGEKIVTGDASQNGGASLEEEDAEGSLAQFLDPALPEAEKRKILKLATLRKKRSRSKEDEFWQVRLPEYMSVYLNRYEACQGFWTSLIPPCHSAMRIDLAELDIQSSVWMQDMENMRTWYSEKSAKESSGPSGAFGRSHKDPFLKKVATFLEDVAPKVEALRKKVLDTRSMIVALWEFFKEHMTSEPTAIFKYIHDFCELFQKQWKALETDWNKKRTMALRDTFDLVSHPLT